MSDVFISYANADREAARRIANAITAHGHAVWWDRIIPPGRVFDEVIQEALAKAKCVVVLWSTASIVSDWVKAEADEAAKRDILVPVLIENVTPPFEFRRIQSANLVGWQDDENHPELRNLVAAVEGATRAPGTAAPLPDRSPLPSTPKATRRTLVALGAIALALGAGAAAFLLLPRDGPTDTDRLAARDAPGHRTAEAEDVAPPPREQAARQTSPPPTASRPPPESSRAVPKSGPAVDLLSKENGGQILVASNDAWTKLIDGNDYSYAYIEGQQGVFGFKDERSATFHTVAVLIRGSSDENIKEFELLAGNDSPTGRFESIGTFTTQNILIFKSPFQTFSFSPVQARYVKLKPISSFGGRRVGVNEIRLLGHLD